jgi:hypothetical protein
MEDFVKNNLVFAKHSEVLGKDLYERYLNWCSYKRIKPISKIFFNRNLVELGFKKVHGTDNQIVFKDVYPLKCKY